MYYIRYKSIDGFKFGGSVQDHHTYICEQELLADFNLAIAIQAVSPPIFRLYGKHRGIVAKSGM